MRIEKIFQGNKIILVVIIFLLIGAIAVSGYSIWSNKYSKEPSEGGKSTTDQKQNIGELPAGEIAVKIVNRGASAGSSEKIKDILKSSGYEKSEIGGTNSANLIQTHIYFNGEKFRINAQIVREILIQKEKIMSVLLMADSDEEKIADIVIFLGENKEAPPN